jgi:Mlc titration factor MtfA (ptsG expression regulator)
MRGTGGLKRPLRLFRASMFFSWLRRRRRDRLLAEPFPQQWLRYLDEHVPHYVRLRPDDRQRLRDLLRIFIAEKNWEGCGGLEMTDEIKLTIAALACLLILHKDPNSYYRLSSILVYPDTYVGAVSQFPLRNPRPIDAREGESWPGGPVILNWEEIVENLLAPRGSNLVLHEFAHQLDMADRYADGMPLLDDPKQYQAWRAIVREEYQRLVDDVRHHRPTVLNKYGAKNEAELFAVATESFFERPRLLQEHHGALYRLLAEFYHQDPAQWPA